MSAVISSAVLLLTLTMQLQFLKGPGLLTEALLLQGYQPALAHNQNNGNSQQHNTHQYNIDTRTAHRVVLLLQPVVTHRHIIFRLCISKGLVIKRVLDSGIAFYLHAGTVGTRRLSVSAWNRKPPHHNHQNGDKCTSLHKESQLCGQSYGKTSEMQKKTRFLFISECQVTSAKLKLRKNESTTKQIHLFFMPSVVTSPFLMAKLRKKVHSS